MMSLEDSVSLVKYAFTNATNGDLFVKKAPACSVETLVTAVIKVIRVEGKVKINQIGTRHGEKLYESLISREEMAKAEDMANYYRIPADNRDLNYAQYFSEGEEKISHQEDYTSHNTKRLNIAQIKELLLKLEYIKDELDV